MLLISHTHLIYVYIFMSYIGYVTLKLCFDLFIIIPYGFEVLYYGKKFRGLTLLMVLINFISFTSTDK